MGIPAKVAENSFIAAEKLIRVQFPSEPYFPSASKSDSPTSPVLSKGDASGGQADGAGASTATSLGEGGEGGGGRQHPMGVVCSCVRTGWSLMSSLFCVGEEVTYGSLWQFDGKDGGGGVDRGSRR